MEDILLILTRLDMQLDALHIERRLKKLKAGLVADHQVGQVVGLLVAQVVERLAGLLADLQAGLVADLLVGQAIDQDTVLLEAISDKT